MSTLGMITFEECVESMTGRTDRQMHKGGWFKVKGRMNTHLLVGGSKTCKRVQIVKKKSGNLISIKQSTMGKWLPSY